MILRDGSVKVADFGIARLVSSVQSTMTQEALGNSSRSTSMASAEAYRLSTSEAIAFMVISSEGYENEGGGFVRGLVIFSSVIACLAGVIYFLWITVFSGMVEKLQTRWAA